ncbi:MAG: TonB-dependent receptor [Vicinamibacterales bacterium]
MGFLRNVRLRSAIVIALCLIGLWAAPERVDAQPRTTAAPAGQPATVTGVVTTQNATIPLAGVLVSLQLRAVDVASTATDGDGAFRFEGVEPGAYTVVAVLDGFDTMSMPVTVSAGEVATLKADLRIASMSERVEVVAATAFVPTTGTISSTEEVSSREIEEVTGGGGLSSALRLLASVIEVPGGVSIKGGRPSQAATQLGAGALVDPSTGLSQVSLPDDAVETVTVLPNPYAVEYGRFSSGLVLIRTRRAGDQWKTRMNNLEPAFRVKRGSALNITGLASMSPRAETGGPLIKDKLFLEQSVQYRYRTNDVASRPENELKRSDRFSSFSRLDANLSPRHSLVGAIGLFPSKVRQATLGTFTPPEASVDMKNNVSTIGVTERAIWSDAFFTETTVEAHRYSTDVMPRGSATMELLPEAAKGSFFNRQHRASSTLQVIESVSGAKRGRGVLNLYKAGVDVLYNQFEGTSTSRPVLIRRSDGTLARRLDFPGTQTNLADSSTDFAAYVQDRVQPGERWYAEIGARLDRDGVLRRYNVTPRIGSAYLLRADGSSTIRGGYGLFFERTPTIAGVFPQYESFIDTRYAADGITPLGPPVAVAHAVDPRLRTARSSAWDVGVDHKFNAMWSVHGGIIGRSGRNELLLKTAAMPSGTALRLESSGRSLYREIEGSVHYTHGQRVDLNVSYVRSFARSNLNALTSFYDSVLAPVVGEDAYAPASSDVPHRLLMRWRTTPLQNWLFVGTLDWRTGLPYSVVNEWLDFVGARNARRFPTYLRVDAGLEHRFTFGKHRPWIGVRVDNALSSFLPSDVQANLNSPAFGTFYNSEYRQYRIQVRFQR